jgi:mRNA-capping enzyme
MSEERPAKRYKYPFEASQARLQQHLNPPTELSAALRKLICCHIFSIAEYQFDSLPSYKTRSLPGPLPISLSRSKLRDLSLNAFWVAEKSDGIRRMFVVTESRAFLVDRAWTTQELARSKAICSVVASKGITIVDGELVNSPYDDRGCFLAYDAIVVNGEHVGSSKFSVRLDALKKKVIDPLNQAIAAEGVDTLKFMMKLIVPHSAVDQIFSKIMLSNMSNSKEYWFIDEESGRKNKNDGVIFTAENEPYLPTSHSALLKWKWPDLNTVDFKIQAPFFDDRNGELRLYCGGPKGMELFLRSTPISHTLRTWIETDLRNRSDGRSASCIMECGYDRATSCWKVLKERPDKVDANYLTTVFSTLETIIDDVQKREIIASCKAFRGS